MLHASIIIFNMIIIITIFIIIIVVSIVVIIVVIIVFAFSVASLQCMFSHFYDACFPFHAPLLLPITVTNADCVFKFKKSLLTIFCAILHKSIISWIYSYQSVIMFMFRSLYYWTTDFERQYMCFSCNIDMYAFMCLIMIGLCSTLESDMNSNVLLLIQLLPLLIYY